MGVPAEGVAAVWKGWYGSPQDRVATLCKLLSGLEQEWPTKVDRLRRLRLGVYSPVQLLLWQCGRSTKSRLQFEFPFCFSTVGYVAATVLQGFDLERTFHGWPRSAAVASAR